jgi:sodium-dependent dicarboxylate transporter 2/3/5
MSYEEKVVLWVFVGTALLWISRSFIEKFIPAIDDTIIAMTAGIILFIIPAKNKTRIIDWKECSNIPWGIILLFGGGMALAKGFSDTGLAEWIALQMGQMQGFSLIILIFILVASVNFLTEITSNLATTAMLLPVLAPMALAFDLHPYMIMVSVTLAASCAFMLPVATPPNAVVFGSGYLRIPDMMRAGIWMNLVSIVLITLFTYFLLPMIWNIVPDAFPASFNLLNK